MLCANNYAREYIGMLCSSLMHDNNILCADRTIQYDPAKSVLKLRIGDEIKLTQADFTRLVSAFLAEIEHKYLPD